MKNEESKYSSDEATKIYFKAAERNANQQIKRFKQKLDLGNTEIERSDLIQMEIDRISEIVKSDYHLINKGRQGFSDVPTKDLIEYLDEELRKHESYIWVDMKYQQFSAIQSYKYLKKLKSELSELHKWNLLDEFFNGFKPKEHEKTLVGKYLMQWESNKGFWNARSRAKNIIKDEFPIIDSISGSVIKNWEDKWEEFLSSRTEKNGFD